MLKIAPGIVVLIAATLALRTGCDRSAPEHYYAGREHFTVGNAATVKNDQLAKTVSEPIPELKDPTENDERRELPKEHYKLSPLMEKALRSEIDLLMSKIWKQFPDSPPAEADRIVVDKYKNKSGDDLGYALALNVAQRILNIHHPFSVKVQFSELPRGRTINGFVRKYNVGKFERVGRNRRATAKNTFSGSVGTFRDFDRLCKIRQLEYDGVKVNISSRYMFTKCPPQLKFDKVTKEAIESQSVTKQSKDADQSTSESDSANNSIETKDEIQKEINIVIEFKVEKEGDKKGDDATGKSFETASKLNSDEIVTKPALAQIKKEEELKRENTENKKVDLKPDVDQSEAIKGEANESRKMNKDDTIKNQQIAAGKLNTPKLTQNDLDEKEFEDILKNSIVLDECIASDED